MLLNANKIMPYIIDESNLAEKAQVGVDLTINKLYEIEDGFVLTRTDKTMSRNDRVLPINGFLNVERGKVYSLEMDQGLKNLPNNLTAFIQQRSTLARNGLVIRSSVIDPGFGTEKIGAILYAHNTGKIEEHMRVAQIIVQGNEPTELYNGQYNNKNTARNEESN